MIRVVIGNDPTPLFAIIIAAAAAANLIRGAIWPSRNRRVG